MKPNNYETEIWLQVGSDSLCNAANAKETATAQARQQESAIGFQMTQETANIFGSVINDGSCGLQQKNICFKFVINLCKHKQKMEKKDVS